MKKKLLFCLGIAYLIICTNCNRENVLEVNNDSSNSDEMVELSFNLKGEYISEEDVPLRRNSDLKVYYAFQIDTLRILKIPAPHNPSIIYLDTTYQNYSEGLFDSTNDLRVELPVDRKFRINVAVIKEFKDKIYHEDNIYFNPFTKSDEGTELKNMFIINKNSRYELNNLWIDIFGKDGKIKTSTSARVDRYYTSFLYVPEKNSNIIDVPLKRYTFGLNFIITPPTDGTLRVTDDYNFDYSVKYNDNTLETEDIFALNPSYYDTNPNYKNKVYLKIKWKRENNSEVNYTKELEFSRNTKKIVKINLNNRDNESSFDFNYEDYFYNEEIVEIK